jgi:hypothetical protein
LALWDRDEARLEGASTSLKGIADVEGDLASVQRAASATLARFNAI